LKDNVKDQASYSWLRSAFYLKWGLARGSPNSARTSTRTTSNAVDESSERKCVTLICFSPPLRLVNRFIRLLHNEKWRCVLKNPFDLWVVVVDEVFAQMDDQAWNLATVFKGTERVSEEYMYIFRWI
jgi:hypothetical protein